MRPLHPVKAPSRQQTLLSAQPQRRNQRAVGLRGESCGHHGQHDGVGYPTARSAHELARKHGVEAPIIEQVHTMLYAGKDVRQAVQDLTARESKAED